MLGGSADTASHALLYNLTSGQSSRLKLIYLFWKLDLLPGWKTCWSQDLASMAAAY